MFFEEYSRTSQTLAFEFKEKKNKKCNGKRLQNVARASFCYRHAVKRRVRMGHGTWDSVTNKIINLIAFPFHQARQSGDAHMHTRRRTVNGSLPVYIVVHEKP